MNEKIKEFAKEHFVNSYYTEWGWENCHRYEFSEEELEKFVELVVKECAQCARDEVTYYTTYAHADSVKKEIEEHFGVK